VSDRIRFHLDEQVNSAIAIELRRRGIDVTTTVEAGLRTQRDDAHLTFARQEQRVLFTQDEDFLILASRSNDHSGIAYCKQGTRSIGQIIESLILIYEVYTPEEMIGHIEYL
jgi:predicted nuclease of predicted toxin-antitoxin system